MLQSHEFHYETRLLSNSEKGGGGKNDVVIIISCFNDEPSFILQFVLAPDAAVRKGSRREETLTKLLLHSDLSSRCHWRGGLEGDLPQPCVSFTFQISAMILSICYCDS